MMLPPPCFMEVVETQKLPSWSLLLASGQIPGKISRELCDLGIFFVVRSPLTLLNHLLSELLGMFL